MAKKRNLTPKDVAIRQRRQRVAEMYLHGKSQWEIATILNLNQSTVSRDLEAIRLVWRESAIMDFDQRQAQELAKIDALEVTYLDAWERSKANAETKHTKVKAKKGDKNPYQEVAKKEEGQVGDPRYLEGVRWCITKRLEIFCQIPANDKAAQESQVLFQFLTKQIAMVSNASTATTQPTQPQGDGGSTPTLSGPVAD